MNLFLTIWFPVSLVIIFLLVNALVEQQREFNKTIKNIKAVFRKTSKELSEFGKD